MICTSESQDVLVPTTPRFAVTYGTCFKPGRRA